MDEMEIMREALTLLVATRAREAMVAERRERRAKLRREQADYSHDRASIMLEKFTLRSR